MSLSGIGVILLDIEGTTTPIAFVHETLSTFARSRLSDWMSRHADTVEAAEIADQLDAEYEHERRAGTDNLPRWRGGDVETRRESVAAFAGWLMERDRKSTGLKQLQGLIWEEGYQAGQLRGVVYDDVPDALRRWRHRGIEVAIYSSGSELAQRRLFESTPQGDLTPLLSAFFDTRVGAKVSAESYRAIALQLGRRPDELLFVSDMVSELRAAAAAGCATRLSVRPGNAAQPGAECFEVVTSLAAVVPEERAI